MCRNYLLASDRRPAGQANPCSPESSDLAGRGTEDHTAVSVILTSSRFRGVCGAMLLELVRSGKASEPVPTSHIPFSSLGERPL